MNPIYSIIIPHKGTPELLNRCLESIPRRDDVQVIVVEDVWGKGAGFVRNQGLKQAKGKWLIFSDADDWFSDEFDSLLDIYGDSDAEIVYFRPKSALDKPSERIMHIERLFELGDERLLRYMYITPWGKFIKKSLVDKYHYCFDEVKWGNDAFFITQVATTAEKIIVSDKILYIVDEVEGSLTHSNGCFREELICRTKIDIRCYEFAESKSFNPTDEVLFYRIKECVKHKLWLTLLRTIKSLPPKARISLKRKYTNQMNTKGLLVVNIIELMSNLVRKL